MKLTPATVTALPLAAAIVDADNIVLTHTPEWRGPGLGTASYLVGTNSLLVTPVDQSAHLSPLVDELILAMKAAPAEADDEFKDRLLVNASAFDIIFGRRPRDIGTVGHVVRFLRSMSPLHPGTELVVRPGTVGPDAPVRSPGAVAMALHQIIRNASVHGNTGMVSLGVSTHGEGSVIFSLDWASTKPFPTHPIKTSRAVSRRVGSSSSDGLQSHQGWGLGYVAVAADALGAIQTPGFPGQDGLWHATFEFGVPRFMLPVASFQDWRVVDTTPGWEGERGCPQRGEPLGLELEGVIRDAKAAPGQIVARGNWLGRHVLGANKTYVALPPDGMVQRAQDIILGCTHEQATWQVREPIGTNLTALLVLIGRAAGLPPEKWLAVPGGSNGIPRWQDTFTAAATVLGLAAVAPDVHMPCLDARAAAYLYWRFGEGWGWREAAGMPDRLLTLRIRPEFASHPMLPALGIENGELMIEWSREMLERGSER